MALRFHWCADGFLAEGRRQLGRLLAADSRPAPVRARVLWCAAWVALLQGDFTGAEERLDVVQDLCGRLAVASVEADVQGLRGTLASFRREAGVLYLFDAALAMHRSTGDGPEQLFWLFQKVIVQVRLGHPDALVTSERAVEIAERHGEQLYRSYALAALSFALWAHGDEEGALARARSALEILQGFNDYTGTVVDQSCAVRREAGQVAQCGRGGVFGLPDRQVFGGDDAVSAVCGLAAVDERAAVAGGDDGVFEALGADGVVLVEGAVVELAEPDRQAGAFEQAVFDADVAALGFPAGPERFGFLADGGESLAHVVGAGPVSGGLAAAVGVEEVPQTVQAALVDGGGQQAGPGGVVVHVALGRAVGQCSGGRRV